MLECYDFLKKFATQVLKKFAFATEEQFLKECNKDFLDEMIKKSTSENKSDDNAEPTLSDPDPKINKSPVPQQNVVQDLEKKGKAKHAKFF